MSRKDAIDLVLSKVDADKKEAFIAEMRETKSKEERGRINEKYNVVLTEEETAAFRDAMSNKLSDEDLDAASGGGCFEEDKSRPDLKTYDCGCLA